MKKATAELPYYTAHSNELEFISRIKPDGSGTVPVKNIPDEVFILRRLSISENTWIASGFNTFIVKPKEKS